MRIALLGAGTIARLTLEHLARGALEGLEVVGILGRSAASPGADLARANAVPYVLNRAAHSAWLKKVCWRGWPLLILMARRRNNFV